MKIDPDRITQLQRTRRGVCARCGEEWDEHPGGNCPDGGGSFTWAHTRTELEAMVKRMEDFVAKAKGSRQGEG